MKEITHELAEQWCMKYEAPVFDSYGERRLVPCNTDSVRYAAYRVLVLVGQSIPSEESRNAVHSDIIQFWYNSLTPEQQVSLDHFLETGEII